MVSFLFLCIVYSIINGIVTAGVIFTFLQKSIDIDNF